jgi:hypothetical protein
MLRQRCALRLAAAPLSAGELDALPFRFWSADHKRFDHIGFAHAVIAASARAERQREP